MSTLLIPIAIEWVILVTTASPLLLIGRFENCPRIGLAIWFAALLSSGLATALAVGIAINSIFKTYLALVAEPLGSSEWLATLGVSFAPWVILAVSGIALGLANQQLEPILATARQTGPMFDAALRPLMKFEGYQVMSIDLPILVAAAAKGNVVVSTAASRSLVEAELAAVVWHEIGHLRGRHNQLKQLAESKENRSLSQDKQRLCNRIFWNLIAEAQQEIKIQN